jgi:DNA end-binding protein Ku
VLLDQDEIDAVRIESRRTLDLVQFVAADEIDVLYYEKPYFVLPADALAEDAYAVLREALRTSKKAGLGQLSVRGREQLVALKPCGRGLILEVLRYADEVVAAQSCFRGLPDEKVDPEMLELATAIIDRRTAPFRPAEFHDRYVDALHRLIDAKRKAHGERILEEAPAPAGSRANVIDLMAALRQSAAVDGAKPSRLGRTRARAAAPKRAKTG